MTQLDISMSIPKYFTVGQVQAGGTGTLESSWSLTLTRNGPSAGYGPYTVVFTQDGMDWTASTIAASPDINPMGAGPGTTGP